MPSAELRYRSGVSSRPVSSSVLLSSSSELKEEMLSVLRPSINSLFFSDDLLILIAIFVLRVILVGWRQSEKISYRNSSGRRIEGTRLRMFG